MGEACCADEQRAAGSEEGGRGSAARGTWLAAPTTQHGCSVTRIVFPQTLDIPADVLAIAERLEGAGFETWCVGGAVRDNLLGHPNKDFDLATTARPEQVRALFGSGRTIPVGVEHGTVAVLDRRRRPHEVTTFRRDVRTDGRHATVEFGVSLEEDLARRDFTINAIAYHPVKREWRDLHGGREDLERKVVRAVGEPARRFREDYLRILRALRFATRFGFIIEPATWEAAAAHAGGLAHLSAERVRDEWFRALQGAKRASDVLVLWRAVGALPIWLPAIDPEAAGGRADVIDRLPRDPLLITSYLSRAPGDTLRRLRCSNAEVERSEDIGRHRGAFPDPDERAVRRWIARVGPRVGDLTAIHRAETGGAALEDAVGRVRRSGAPLAVADLAVTGSDLLALGTPQGPAVGAVLRDLLEAVLDDPRRNTKEELLTMAKRLLPHDAS